MSSKGVPEVLMKKVDEYVDSLAPQIQPRITSELETFQQRTIDSLEDQVVDAFRSLFNKDKGSSGAGTRGPLNDNAPDAYGGQSLPFADEIAKLTKSFTKISDEAGDDLRDIFALTEGGENGQTQSRGMESSRGGGGAKGFLSTALNAVQDHLENSNKGSGGQGFELDGLLGVLSNTVKDASRNPEEKARLISPEIKDKVAEKLRMQHAPIAEQFTRIALDHIKRWLRGNTSTRDLGDGAKAEIEDHVKDIVKGIGGLFGNKNKSNNEGTRGMDDQSRAGDDGEKGGGFSRVISDKLSVGLAKVHREVRLEFRKILGAIEKQLFEMLPEQFQRPLEKILGGNPFDSQLDREAGGQRDRGFGDDIKAKLVKKIRDLIRKVQETLREGILGVVNGGHRKFERESWVFVQRTVEGKVQRYLPNVKINVPDDIGNENVSVGAPNAESQFTGGNQSGSPPQGNNGPPPSNEPYGGQPHHQPQRYSPPPQHQQQDYRPNNQQQHHDNRPQQSQYPPPSHHNEPSQYQSNQSQGYGQNQDYSNNQGYQNQYQNNPPSQGYQNQNYSQNQGYQSNQGGYQQGSQNYQQNQGGYQQGQNYQQHNQGGYQQNHGYNQNQGYQQDQGYGQNPRY